MQESVTIIYVVPGGTGGGTSWADGKDLGAALSGASSGSELWVKAGTYKPTIQADRQDPRTATFTLKNGVAVYGGFAGTETTRDGRNWRTNVTILSGDIGRPNDTGDNSYNVVTAGDLAAGPTLDGFTITGGNANADNYADAGGGMNIWNASPILTNLIFSGNFAQVGGGTYMYGSNAMLTNIVFTGNTAEYGGGGMSNNLSYPTLTNVTFSGNSARSYGAIVNSYYSAATICISKRGCSTGNCRGGAATPCSSPSTAARSSPCCTTSTDPGRSRPTSERVRPRQSWNRRSRGFYFPTTLRVTSNVCAGGVSFSQGRR